MTDEPEPKYLGKAVRIKTMPQVPTDLHGALGVVTGRTLDAESPWLTVTLLDNSRRMLRAEELEMIDGQA